MLDKLIDQGHAMPSVTYNRSSATHVAPINYEPWTTLAQSTLEAIFPSDHAVLKRWSSAMTVFLQHNFLTNFHRLVGVTTGAKLTIENGLLSTLTDAIRIDTESDVIDQAEELRESGYLTAATVLAGGALEAHLRYLCDKHCVTIQGAGSISKYNNAIGSARKNNVVDVYSKNTGKEVLAWGGKRNEAAHTPAQFSESSDDVRRMIEGVRSFIERNV